jgi:hypothetical protein
MIVKDWFYSHEILIYYIRGMCIHCPLILSKQS